MSQSRPVLQPGSRRLVYFTPLRYPGGKGKLAPFVKRLIELNELSDGTYVEPYAGGAAIATELVLQEYVRTIYINDISRPVYAFWKSVLDRTDDFCRRIRNTPLTVDSWDKQKAILANHQDHDDLALGFATFFLNRTNRSGILNAGVIGGRKQLGPWKIDARFNASELIYRIESIARLRQRIIISGDDAKAFLVRTLPKLPQNTLIYLDPPYYLKGKDLYYDYYSEEDHAEIAALVRKKIRRQFWIVSYDNVRPIIEMYAGFRYATYSVAYSARDFRQGNEVMFFSNRLKIPASAPVGPQLREQKWTRTAR